MNIPDRVYRYSHKIFGSRSIDESWTVCRHKQRQAASIIISPKRYQKLLRDTLYIAEASCLVCKVVRYVDNSMTYKTTCFCQITQETLSRSFIKTNNNWTNTSCCIQGQSQNTSPNRTSCNPSCLSLGWISCTLPVCTRNHTKWTRLPRSKWTKWPRSERKLSMIHLQIKHSQ